MSVETHHSITVPIERAVTGATISDGEHALCGRCGQPVGEGSPVSVYAYSMAGEHDVTVARINCIHCAPDTIAHPTLGGTDWLVRGTLALQSDVARQSHQLVFVSSEGAIDTSPPTESSEEEIEEQLKI